MKKDLTHAMVTCHKPSLCGALSEAKETNVEKKTVKYLVRGKWICSSNLHY